MRTIVDRVGVLSDEDSADGQPVLLVGGKVDQPRGPGDEVKAKGGPQPAWKLVEEWMNWTKPDGHDRELAEAFVRLGKASAGA